MVAGMSWKRMSLIKDVDNRINIKIWSNKDNPSTETFDDTILRSFGRYR